MPTETVAELDAIGRDLGTIFQIIDDELDLYGDPAQLGKPVAGDIREGRHTLIYALLERHVPAAEWAWLSQLFGHRRDGASGTGGTGGNPHPDDVHRIRAAVDRYGIRRLVQRHLEQTAHRTRARVAALAVDADHRESLRRVLAVILERRP